MNLDTRGHVSREALGHTDPMDDCHDAGRRVVALYKIVSRNF